MGFRCGYVALVGQPNVGKSTLLNVCVGETLAIVTPKPQTTRHRILGIVQRDDAQILFLDSPGFHESRRALNHAMMEVLGHVIVDADVVCLLIEPRLPLSSDDRALFDRIGKDRAIIVVNKGDTVSAESSSAVARAVGHEWGAREAIVISALHDLGVKELISTLVDRLPEGVPLYPKEEITEHPTRFFVTELIREELFLQLQQELPYAAGVVIEEFHDPSPHNPVTRIRAEIIVERESQKGMVIGKGGERIKSIGQAARKKIEELVGGKVFLQLFVRVDKEWTRDPQKIQTIGGII